MVCSECRCSCHCSSCGICLFPRSQVVMVVPLCTPVFSTFFHFCRQYGVFFFPPQKNEMETTDKLNMFSDVEILQRFGDRCQTRNQSLLAVERSHSCTCRRLVPSSCLCPSLFSPAGIGILFNKMEVLGDFPMNSHDLSK